MGVILRKVTYHKGDCPCCLSQTRDDLEGHRICCEPGRGVLLIVSSEGHKVDTIGRLAEGMDHDWTLWQVSCLGNE